MKDLSLNVLAAGQFRSIVDLSISSNAIACIKSSNLGILNAFYNILSTGKFCNIYQKKTHYTNTKKPWHCALIYCKKP